MITVHIIHIINENLITVSLIAIQQYCDYSQDEILEALEYLHTHGYLERRSNTVYVKTEKWNML